MSGRRVDFVNACLISAAPDLFEACQRMIGVMGVLGYEQAPNTLFMIEACKKATGDTK